MPLDLEDAASVLDRHKGRLDEALMRREIALLVREIPDHDISRRFSALVERQS